MSYEIKVGDKRVDGFGKTWAVDRVHQRHDGLDLRVMSNEDIEWVTSRNWIVFFRPLDEPPAPCVPADGEREFWDRAACAALSVCADSVMRTSAASWAASCADALLAARRERFPK